MDTLRRYIHSYFGIQPEQMDDLVPLFQRETLEKGDFFVRQEQFCDKMSFIHKGYIRIYRTHQTKEITQWISSPSYFITDLNGLLFDQRSKWNMQAISTCELFTIRKKEYDQLPSVLPNWKEIENLFIAHCFMTVENRVFEFLSQTAEERYQAYFKENKEIFNQVPLQYLASLLGMTPETLSRIRNKGIS